METAVNASHSKCYCCCPYTGTRVATVEVFGLTVPYRIDVHTCRRTNTNYRE